MGSAGIAEWAVPGQCTWFWKVHRGCLGPDDILGEWKLPAVVECLVLGTGDPPRDVSESLRVISTVGQGYSGGCDRCGPGGREPCSEDGPPGLLLRPDLPRGVCLRFDIVTARLTCSGVSI